MLVLVLPTEQGLWFALFILQNVAQLVERSFWERGVVGSNPIILISHTFNLSAVPLVWY